VYEIWRSGFPPETTPEQENYNWILEYTHGLLIQIVHGWEEEEPFQRADYVTGFVKKPAEFSPEAFTVFKDQTLRNQIVDKRNADVQTLESVLDQLNDAGKRVERAPFERPSPFHDRDHRNKI
jgi:hypothetical protein